ncbi:MBL fold metallo-hydrolase [Candidatus Venteria ishoeyi]|uniref:Putative metallo-hydrolase n=1 Tax=Candidatus Venteria ishoeyi TaxID=1899563 RepID=A0A1H6FI93_9GAMM|nr:MBL fold metallo-hydrolase [Candidatus Venteria ishoeyi]MDM8547382.1 MBL fold metallo-hydrolase [Candidatus Venteria ishoeyi]SEH08734.1 putative metallo-hydrolase [Candidatus Venteria ishoeyi]
MLQYKIIPVTDFQQNSTLLWCDQSQKAALIDPGGEPDLLCSELESRKLIPEKILLTHAHIDHVGAVAELARRWSIPIEGPHQADRFWLDSLAEQCQVFGFPKVESFIPQRWLKQHDQVTVGELLLEVRHCPGHTPGHIIFYHADSKLAWVGDVLFKGSIGRTDFPQSDTASLLKCIREQLLPLGDEVRFIPGHGPMSSFGEERHSNPFLR